MDRKAEKRYLISESRAVTDGGTVMVYEYGLGFAGLPQGFDGVRLLHLSDLHAKTFGRNSMGLVKICAAQRPDLIFFTGDMFSRNEGLSAIMRKIPLMRALSSVAPLYCVFGNHECDVPHKAEHFGRTLEKIGVTLLRNGHTRICRGKGHIDLYGLELPPHYYRSPRGDYIGLPHVTREVVEQFLGKPHGDGFTLLLAHNPLPFEQYAEWGADLTLSGHIHGGVIRIGGVGLLSPERMLFPRYSKGIYTLQTTGGTAMLGVSAGLGKFRLNDPMMIASIVLKRKVNDK